MNKVVYVAAYFAPRYEEITEKVATGEKKKGFMGGEKDVFEKVNRLKQVGLSDCQIDGERLANDLAEAIAKLNEQGYEVVTVTSVLSGEYHWETKADSLGAPGMKAGTYGWGYGYGFSYTNSLIVIARRTAA